MEQSQYKQNKPNLPPTQTKQIAQAAEILLAGGTVAFPTETVYGLGAIVTNPDAISKIYSLKQRPLDHPLIVHIGDIAHLHDWARDIPAPAWILANHFWPGPLTLILRRSHLIPDCVTGGQDTVGIRIPAHPVALALLSALGPSKALAAPSANRFGRISPTTAKHVQEELGSKVDMILDGGACEIGLESTIISFCDKDPQILRPGGISLSELESVLRHPITLAHNNTKQTIRSPGSLPAHYAPTTPVRLYATNQIWHKAAEFAAQGLKILIMTWSGISQPPSQPQSIQQCTMPTDPILYGKQLYAKLHQLDHEAYDYIIIETPPDDPAWLAISDRLQRASHHLPVNNTQYNEYTK